jgi:hypothetical protein
MTKDFNWIESFQNDFYPDWKEKPRLLFSNALAGEVGEVCGVVTHLDGGGTNNRKYTEQEVLHQCVDSYVQLVLLVLRSGFTEKDFDREFQNVKKELEQRLIEKQSLLGIKHD